MARHGLTNEQYQAEFDRLVGQGYRLVDVSGYSIGGQDRYAAIWEQTTSPPWAARHGLTSAQYQQAFNLLAQQGYRPVRVRAWRAGDDAHFAAIWEKAPGPDWQARHGLLSQLYQETFDAMLKEGFRLRHVAGYSITD